MKILSVHSGHHHASVCILNDGNLEKYFLVERYTRKKYDGDERFALNLVRDICAKLKEKLDVICISDFEGFFKYNDSNDDPIIRDIFNESRKHNPNLKLIFQSNHHLNHASHAFYNSKFDESLVVVVDGIGGSVTDNLVEVESIFSFNRQKNTLIYKNVIKSVVTKFERANPGAPGSGTQDSASSSVSFVETSGESIANNLDIQTIHRRFLNMWTTNDNPSEVLSDYECKNIYGIGLVYSMASTLMGNTMLDCGKAMGLSSYGTSNKLFENLFLEKNTFNNSFFENSSQEIKHFLTNPVKEITKDNYQLYADFCYEVQQQTQKAVGDLIEDHIIKTGIKKVCITGGYGMNIVANYYYLQRFPDVEFYFEPICDDSGVNIGAAMNTYIQLTDKIPSPIETTFFNGTHYDISSYQGMETSIVDVANLLYKDKSVAVYRGLAEAGPRALGNRSILFNALNPNAKDIVNKIKKREWYRPFACVVLEEDSDIYFDMGRIKSSPSMTICFPVKQKYIEMLSGISHVDNTCRIQTVSEGYLYELLQEFKKLSGHGILLNTSLNLSGEPLVETPTDAIKIIDDSHLDYLWLEQTQKLLQSKNRWKNNFTNLD